MSDNNGRERQRIEMLKSLKRNQQMVQQPMAPQQQQRKQQEQQARNDARTDDTYDELLELPRRSAEEAKDEMSSDVRKALQRNMDLRAQYDAMQLQNQLLHIGNYSIGKSIGVQSKSNQMAEGQPFDYQPTVQKKPEFDLSDISYKDSTLPTADVISKQDIMGYGINARSASGESKRLNCFMKLRPDGKPAFFRACDASYNDALRGTGQEPMREGNAYYPNGTQLEFGNSFGQHKNRIAYEPISMQEYRDLTDATEESIARDVSLFKEAKAAGRIPDDGLMPTSQHKSVVSASASTMESRRQMGKMLLENGISIKDRSGGDATEFWSEHGPCDGDDTFEETRGMRRKHIHDRLSENNNLMNDIQESEAKYDGLNIINKARSNMFSIRNNGMSMPDLFDMQRQEIARSNDAFHSLSDLMDAHRQPDLDFDDFAAGVTHRDVPDAIKAMSDFDPSYESSRGVPNGLSNISTASSEMESGFEM